MARATYMEIATVIVTNNDALTKADKFIVCLPSSDEECLTVYPPTSYKQDYGIDIYLSDNTAEIWQDGYKIRKLNSIQDATVVADAIIEEIKKTERIFKEEQ